MADRGVPKWPTGAGKWSIPRFIGRSNQLLLNKFFDSSTPCMRNIDNREGKNRGKRENNWHERSALQLVAVRRSTVNNVSGHYFRRSSKRSFMMFI